MSNYLRDTLTAQPLQGERARADQIQDSDGAYVWGVDAWGRLERFLILGSEGGTYYATEHDLTKENISVVKECLDSDWHRTILAVADISSAGRAPKNDPAILVLAVASTYDLTVEVVFDPETPPTTRAEVLENTVRMVCRTGTHLLFYVSLVDTLRGWGPALRRVVSGWYLAKSDDDLALQLVKYRSRYGWTHHDVMHKAHPAFVTEKGKAVAKFAKDGKVRKRAPVILQAYKQANSPKATHTDVIEAIAAGLPREGIPTELLRKPEVWDALLVNMPMTAMIRNIATMTRIGLVTRGSDAAKTISECLADQERLNRARVHPIQVLSALLTYKSGRGQRGSNTWKPVTSIVDALDAAFYLSFGSLKRVNADVCLALDVSSSMDGHQVAGVPGLTARVASAAMAMVTYAQYASVETVAFSHHLIGLPLSPNQRLDDILQIVNRLPFGYTDCALPMVWAKKDRERFDAFHVYTDNETNARGSIQPHAALLEYRKLNQNAKLVVVGMASNGFTIADPKDPGMLDVVGFDTAVPNIIADFSA